jgi:hypothetical protein
MDSIDKNTRNIIRKFNLQNNIWKIKYINEEDMTLDIKSLIIKNFSFLMEFTEEALKPQTCNYRICILVEVYWLQKCILSIFKLGLWGTDDIF